MSATPEADITIAFLLRPGSRLHHVDALVAVDQLRHLQIAGDAAEMWPSELQPSFDPSDHIGNARLAASFRSGRDPDVMRV
jgi:hypothetical protein